MKINDEIVVYSKTSHSDDHPYKNSVFENDINKAFDPQNKYLGEVMVKDITEHLKDSNYTVFPLYFYEFGGSAMAFEDAPSCEENSQHDGVLLIRKDSDKTPADVVQDMNGWMYTHQEEVMESTLSDSSCFLDMEFCSKWEENK